MAEIEQMMRTLKLGGLAKDWRTVSFNGDTEKYLTELLELELHEENLDFIKARENLIFMGAVGTGKTHLATAIALNACKAGHQVRFFTAAALANILLERNNKGTLSGFMNGLGKTELIVIDEFGFVPLHKDAAELMFQVISECYERKSLIMTSNLEFSGWNTVLGDNRLTAALIDRLVHHSHIVIFSGESYRLRQSMKRQMTMGD